MKFTFTVVVSNKDLNKVSAKLLFTAFTVDAEVEAYTMEDYFKEYEKTAIFYGLKDTESLVVLRITVSFKHKEAYSRVIPEEERYTYKLMYLSERLHPKILSKKDYELSTDCYTTAEVNGGTLTMSDIRSVTGSDQEVIERLQKLEVLDELKDEVEAVIFSFGNPFNRCDISRLKAIDIRRHTVEKSMIDNYFTDYCAILDTIYKKHGSDAFPSLTRIGGNARELDYFFSLFNNRKFEYMLITGSLPKTEGLSVDVANITEGTGDFYRVVAEENPFSLPLTRRLMKSKVVEIDIMEGEDADKSFPVVDLSDYHCTESIAIPHMYSLISPDAEGDDEDEDYDPSETVPFHFVLEFDRLGKSKSARY